MKTTKATFAPDLDEPKFEFEPVDASLIPRGRESTDVPNGYARADTKVLKVKWLTINP